MYLLFCCGRRNKTKQKQPSQRINKGVGFNGYKKATWMGMDGIKWVNEQHCVCEG